MTRIILWVLTGLVFLFFGAGYYFSVEAYPDKEWPFFFYNLLSMFAALYLVFSFRNLAQDKIIVMIVGGFFMAAYFLKFYLIVYVVNAAWANNELWMLFGFYVLKYLDLNLMYYSFEIFVVSFLGVSLAAGIILKIQGNSGVSPIHSVIRPVNGRSALDFLALSLVVSAITGFFRWYYNLSFPEIATDLPFKLRGFINVVNGLVVPLLFTIALSYSLASPNRRLFVRIAGVFLVHGIIQYLLFFSKTYLIFPAVTVGILSVINRKTKIRWEIIGGAGVGFVFLYPFFNFYRQFQWSGSGSGLQDLLLASYVEGVDVYQLSGWFSLLVTGLILILGRFVGFDSMLVLVGSQPGYSDFSIMEFILYEKSVSEILTKEIIGPTHGGGVGPSLIGQAYFITGNLFMTVLWVVAWFSIIFWIGKKLENIHTPLGQAIWISWILFVFQMLMAGISVKPMLWYFSSVVLTLVLVKAMFLFNGRELKFNFPGSVETRKNYG